MVKFTQEKNCVQILTVINKKLSCGRDIARSSVSHEHFAEFVVKKIHRSKKLDYLEIRAMGRSRSLRVMH